MPLSETDLTHVWDMLEAARRAVAYTRPVSRDAFLTDAMRRDAVVRVIEIIGEAARGVSPSGRAELAEVEWAAIIATRHIVAHQYDAVDHEVIRRIATVHVPVLVAQLEPVLARHPPPPEASKDLVEP